jgi:hypothetical protein
MQYLVIRFSFPKVSWALHPPILLDQHYLVALFFLHAFIMSRCLSTPCSARRELCYIAIPGCHSALPLRSHNASTEEGRALEHATHA